MMTAVEGMHGGLSSLADSLQIERIGPMHQAGSDSLLTAQAFFTLLKKNFNSVCDDSKYVCLFCLFFFVCLFVCLLACLSLCFIYKSLRVN
jgi:CCR4-NOT transcription complex subunit 7/8